jgi:HrpA-like RNA helicase
MGGGKKPSFSGRTQASQLANTNKITIDPNAKPSIARGHRQKGSGNVIVGKAAVVTQDGIVLKAHERLPTQLLTEYCQREKRPLPIFKPKGPGNRHIVWLNDKKNPNFDLCFLPTETQFESVKVAKDFAALLALFDLQRSMPLERKLPEPYRTTFMAMLTSSREKEDQGKASKKGGKEEACSSASSKSNANAEKELAGKVSAVSLAPSTSTSASSATMGVSQVPELNKATAEWICNSCNMQNFPTLKSGTLRTKCFKCGAVKTDECELVASTAPAVVSTATFKPTSFILAEDTNEGVPSFGFTEPKAKISGVKKNETKGRSQPQARFELQNKHKHNSTAEAERVAAEIKLLKRRKKCFFDALKRANRPTTVILSPTLRFQLEQALGLEVEMEVEQGSAKVHPQQSSSFATIVQYLKSLEGKRVPLKLGSSSGDGSTDKGLGLIPESECMLSTIEQRRAMITITDNLTTEGFKENSIVTAFEYLSIAYEGVLDELLDLGEVTYQKWSKIVQNAVLERLCLSLDNQQLPKRFDARRNEGQLQISVFSKSSTATATATASALQPPLPPADDSTKATRSLLRDYGWSNNEALASLALCSGEAKRVDQSPGATLRLVQATQSVSGGDFSYVIPKMMSDEDGSGGLDEICDEVEMLRSIFGDDRQITTEVHEDSCFVSIDIDISPAIKATPSSHFLTGSTERTTLDVFVHRKMQYPKLPPLYLLRNTTAKNAQVLLCAQLALWKKGAEFAGDTSLYQVILWLETEGRAGFIEEVFCSPTCSPGSPLGISAALNSNTAKSGVNVNVNTSVSDTKSVKSDVSGNSKSSEKTISAGAKFQKSKQRGFWATKTGQCEASILTQEDALKRSVKQPNGGSRKGKDLDLYMKMLDGRKKLPAWKCRQEFLHTIAMNRGMVVTGETGCGKTTQIPQFLLEVEPEAKILVCQPRRLAAVGVATRVAEEMACKLGDDVGYMVRGASASSDKTKLVFCTYGVLLRRLLAEPDLNSVDYVVLDEVHERGMDSDFALGLLAAALGRAGCKFKLVLMSATISTEKFAAYVGKATAGTFSGKASAAYTPAPVHHIPGYTFDVTEYYKEHFEDALSNDNNAIGEDEWGSQKSKGELNYDLLVRLAIKLATGDSSNPTMFAKATGSVLVFLPGVPEITRFCKLLETAWSSVGSKINMRILPLHAGTNFADQKLVFDSAKHNEIKIIAATNVAEASITIPDVSVVVDSCKVKETDFDAEKQMNSLMMKFASKDSLRQRRGRAGRVSAGRCFRLVTSNTFMNLPNHSVPEILRASIDGLVLQIKSMSDGAANNESCVVQLGRCPDAPPEQVIATSEAILTRMQALDADGRITPLGRHIALLPCAPKVGRLLIYGALLGCALPLANVAALLTSRGPFLQFQDQESRDRLNAIKERFGAEAGGRSDQLVIVAVCNGYEKCRGMSAQRRYCQDNLLSFPRMQEIRQMSRDFLSDMVNAGLLNSVKEAQDLDSPCNINSKKWKIVSSTVCAGLYPAISRILRPPKRFEEVMGSAFEKEANSKEIKFYVPEGTMSRDLFEDIDTANDSAVQPKDPFNPRTGGASLEDAIDVLETGTSDDISTEGMFRVFVHPSSIHFGNNSFGQSQFVMYGETRLQATPGRENKSYIQDLTEVGAYPLLFFGGKLEAQYLEGTITVDRWIKFSASGKLVALVQALRRALDEILLKKLENPNWDHLQNPMMSVVFSMLNTVDGLR